MMVNHWPLWRRQIAAIVRLEVRKSLFHRRALILYLLALAPVLLVALLANIHPTLVRTSAVLDATGHYVRERTVVQRHGPLQDPAVAPLVFADLYNAMILRSVVFFGCVWIFMNLFRAELVDRSLHFYFLAAVRREVLVAGKFIAGLVTALTLFSMSTAGALFFYYQARGYDAAMRDIWDGHGMAQVFTYLGMTWLGCLGYGALFLTMGLFFRNPIVPALVVYGWEWLNFLLPPVLKKISIIHYLTSLSRVPLPEGGAAIVAVPTPAYISIPGLVVMTGVLLFLASRRIRSMEINYGSEA
ncbi:MAG: ABC transporter permease family protein [Terriglobales bacterium]